MGGAREITCTCIPFYTAPFFSPSDSVRSFPFCAKSPSVASHCFHSPAFHPCCLAPLVDEFFFPAGFFSVPDDKLLRQMVRGRAHDARLAPRLLYDLYRKHKQLGGQSPTPIYEATRMLSWSCLPPTRIINGQKSGAGETLRRMPYLGCSPIR